jgi:hypothetical protein
MRYAVEMASNCMKYITKSHEDWFGHSGNIKVIPSMI